MFSSLNKYSSSHFSKKRLNSAQYHINSVIPWYISYSTLTWHSIHCVVIFHPFYMPLLAKNILNYNNELVTLHWCHSRQENAYMKVPPHQHLFHSFIVLLISLLKPHQHNACSLAYAKGDRHYKNPHLFPTFTILEGIGM